jgi:hypothetical protein
VRARHLLFERCAVPVPRWPVRLCCCLGDVGTSLWVLRPVPSVLGTRSLPPSLPPFESNCCTVLCLFPICLSLPLSLWRVCFLPPFAQACSGECQQGYYCPAGSLSGTAFPCAFGIADVPESVFCPSSSANFRNVTTGYYSAQGTPTTRSSQVVCPMGSYCVNGVQLRWVPRCRSSAVWGGGGCAANLCVHALRLCPRP